MNYIPKRLSTVSSSPFFDEKIVKKIDKVFVNNVLVPNCVAYDKEAGWAFSKNLITKSWEPKIYGKVTVTLKQ